MAKVTKKATTAQIVEVEKVRDIRSELLNLLKTKMPACFDREPQGMNSGVEKLTDEIIKLF